MVIDHGFLSVTVRIWTTDGGLLMGSRLALCRYMCEHIPAFTVTCIQLSENYQMAAYTGYDPVSSQ